MKKHIMYHSTFILYSIVLFLCILCVAQCAQVLTLRDGERVFNDLAPLPAGGKDEHVFDPMNQHEPQSMNSEVKQYLKSFWKKEAKKEKEKPKDTAWGDEPNPLTPKMKGEGFSDADFGADEGVAKDPTAKVSRDYQDQATVARQKKEALESAFRKLNEKLHRAQDTIARMNSPTFANTLLKEAIHSACVNAAHRNSSVCPMQNGTAQAANSTSKPVTPVFVDEIDDVAHQTHTNSVNSDRNPAFVEVSHPIHPVGDESHEDTSLDVKVDQTPETTSVDALSDDHETEETVLGDLVSSIPSSYKMLPLSIETDGAKPYPISTNELGPQLLTKVGLRLALKGTPRRTDAGDEALDVTGWKVLGPALPKPEDMNNK